MEAIIGTNGTVAIPAELRELTGITDGDRVIIEATASGEIVLTPVEHPSRITRTPQKPQITRRQNSHPVGSTGRIVTTQQVREFLNECEADLAASKGMKLATRDEGIIHASVEVIP